MAQNKIVSTKTPRYPTRQWLTIEVSAYILVCLALVTLAWTNGHLSVATVVVAWVLAGCVLTLTLRGIYRVPREQLKNAIRPDPDAHSGAPN